MLPPPPLSTLFPYTTLFRSANDDCQQSVNQQVNFAIANPKFRMFAVSEAKGQVICEMDSQGRHVVVRDSEPSQIIGESIRSEEHTSELQSHVNLVCRLLLEK